MNRVAVATIGDVLTHDSNMAQTGAGEGGSVDIAVISGVSRPAEVQTGFAGFQNGGDLILSWRDGEAMLSAPDWHGANWSQRVGVLQAVLGVFNCIPKAINAQLLWIFSGKNVLKTDAADLLDRWVQNRAPPVIDLIEFAIANTPPIHILTTIGLGSIVGYEIQADIGAIPNQELARMVGRVAQMVLETGPLLPDIICGPDGSEYQLTAIQSSSAGNHTIQISEKKSDRY